jgi:hypothetical protein
LHDPSPNRAGAPRAAASDSATPPPQQVFLSHASVDKPAVESLRRALADRGVPCWLDALELLAGDDLALELKEKVQGAQAFVVVLSPASVSSPWVYREIEWALAAEDRAAETGGAYRFLPVFTGGIRHGWLHWLKRPDLLGIDANGRDLFDIAVDIAQALGALPADARPASPLAPLPPSGELELDFFDLTYEEKDARERVRGRVRIAYTPSSGAAGAPVLIVFESPLDPIELGEIRWYVETWPGWSFGAPRFGRAEQVEESLPKWGRALFDATAGKAQALWRDFDAAKGERRVVIQVPGAADTGDTTVSETERAHRLRKCVHVRSPARRVHTPIRTPVDT